MNFKSILFFLICLPVMVFAQEPVNNSDIEQKIENIVEETQNEDFDFTVITEALNNYRQRPLNLNNATREELLELGLVNDIQVNNLLAHIRQNGPLISVYELQSIDGFDISTIASLLPFVRVSGEGSSYYSVNEMLKNGGHQVLFRMQQVLEEQKGYTPADSGSKPVPQRYLGSPQKFYARYKFNYGNHVSWGVTAEKDPGEEFFKGTQNKGFDFYSAHLFVRNKFGFKAIAVGDYLVNFGQGLTMWSGLAFGKSTDVIGIRKNGVGLRPYTSVDEINFQRGAAATYKLGAFELTGFYSNKKVDANVTDTIITDDGFIASSLQESGYHSTTSEVLDKHTINNQTAGGNITYRYRSLKIGITAAHTQLNGSFEKRTQLYSIFQPNLSKYTNIGIDYSYLWRNFNFFGEVARSDNGGLATVNGALISLDPKISLSVLHRYYQRDYTVFYAVPFGENTKPNNEQGLFMGVVIKPMDIFNISAYYDQYSFPWLKFGTYAPSTGRDYVLQLNYNPNKKTDFYVRYKNKSGFENSDSSSITEFIDPYTRQNLRFQLSYPGASGLRFKSRFEVTELKGDKGYILYQDIIYSSMNFPVSFSMRYGIFDTPGYEWRIYAFESDIPGVFSIPSFYHKGYRYYFMVNYSINRHFELWARFSQTVYTNQDMISEGSLNEINGNKKSELKLQLRIRF